MGFPDSSVGKESACNAGDPGSIPGSGRSSGKGIGYPLQYSWASFVAQLRVKNPPAMRETWVGKIPGEGKGYPLQYSGLENSMDCIVHGVAFSLSKLNIAIFTLNTSELINLGFPGVSVVKTPPGNAGNTGLIPGSGRSSGEGNGNPPQYSCLENPREGEPMGVTKVRHDLATIHQTTD